MSVIYWAVRIDLTDSTTATVPSIGMHSGYLNWITGRPDYTAGNTPADYTGEAPGSAENPATVTWKEGLLLDGLSPMIRMVKNMEVSGGYGGLSGFKCRIDDTGSVNNNLESNDYFIINRSANVYCFLDDVSYQCWGGIVSDKKKIGSILEIKFEDIFQNAHKQLPPKVLTSTSYENIDKKNIGEAIPITFGNVIRSEIMNVTGKSEPITIGNVDTARGDRIKVTASTLLDSDSNGNTRINLKTPYQNFPANYFKNSGQYFLNVVSGSSESIKITDSDVSVSGGSSNSTTKITLSKMFDDITAYEYNLTDGTGAIYTGLLVSSNVWWFQIYKMDIYNILSNSSINEVSFDEKLDPNITKFNRDTLNYDRITELYTNSDITTSNAIGHPNVTVLNNNIQIDGEFKRYINITPSSVKIASQSMTGGTSTINTLSGDYDKLYDKDPSTYLQLTAVGMDYIRIAYLVEFPSDLVIEGLDEIYLLPDVRFTDVAVNRVIFNIANADVFEQGVYSDSTETLFPIFWDDLELNMLPDGYYNEQRDSQFGVTLYATQYKDMFKVNENLVDSFKKSLASNKIFITFIFNNLHPLTDLDLKIYQLGFVATQNLNVIQDPIYIKMKGETV